MLSGTLSLQERESSHIVIELEALELIWLSPPAGLSLREGRDPGKSHSK